MVAETRKQVLYAPTPVRRRQAEKAILARQDGALARAAEGPRPSFLLEHAHLALRLWFAGWFSTRLF